ncbi:MAG: sulfotransferase [Coleofasciculus sp. C1-SOL-03]|uniref:sulfotransferase family protein n=1 Tax=Coleofasciculus sp. C1-SOL-03 TaxID=3069522 RepID=UPI0032FC6D2C
MNNDSKSITCSNNSERPIFIFGCPRSGTSLLSQILNSHPRIAIPYESHIYNTFFAWLKYYGDLEVAKNRERLVDDIFSTDVFNDWFPAPNRNHTLNYIHRYDFHGVFEAIMSAWANDQGKQRWGEKTPAHLFYWREILDGFPNVQIIHIVRDGRDCALSWKKSRMGPKHIYPTALKWVKHLETIDELKTVLKPDSFLEIKYEELVSNTEFTVRKICDFLEEKYTPEMLNYYKDEVPYKTDKQNLQNLARPIIANNAEKWRTKMTNRQLQIFEAIAGSTLRKYGYATELESPTISTLEQFKYQYIEHPPLKLWAMLKNTKGQIDGLIQLKIYLKIRFGL